MPRGRPRKPLAMQKGHRSNAEKAERAAQEAAIRCPITEFDAPEYLETKKEVDRFFEIVGLLHSVDEQLCTALDADQLARYVMCEEIFVAYSRKLRKAIRGEDVAELGKLQRQQNTAFQQVQACATALGLNVSSRLKFDIRKPDPVEDDDFDRFE